MSTCTTHSAFVFLPISSLTALLSYQIIDAAEKKRKSLEQSRLSTSFFAQIPAKTNQSLRTFPFRKLLCFYSPYDICKQYSIDVFHAQAFV